MQGLHKLFLLYATLAATTAYKDAVLAAFDAGTTAKKLEYIMTEKWINRIENPVDSYTDYRRTDYPVLFAPAPAGNCYKCNWSRWKGNTCIKRQASIHGLCLLIQMRLH